MDVTLSEGALNLFVARVHYAQEEGYGKADIYRSRLIDNVYQTPENLGSVRFYSGVEFQISTCNRHEPSFCRFQIWTFLVLCQSGWLPS